MRLLRIFGPAAAALAVISGATAAGAATTVPVPSAPDRRTHPRLGQHLQAKAIKSLIGTPKESVVLLGDLNATPNAPETRLR